jgi:soluble cytochrome b562
VTTSRWLRISLVPVLLAAAVFIVGRGGSEHSLSQRAYEQQMLSIYGNVRDAFAGTTSNITSMRQLAQRVQRAQTALRDASKQMNALRSPRDVAIQTHGIAAGLDSYATDLDQLRQAADTGDAAKVRTLQSTISSSDSVERIAQAAEEIHAKGYNLGVLSGD